MELLCKIRNLRLAVDKVEKQLAKQHGLSLNEAMLLCFLSNEPCKSSTEIAEALNLPPSNTSKLIRSVEEKEWILRSLGKDDKRCMLFCITPKGEKKLASIHSSAFDLDSDLQHFCH